MAVALILYLPVEHGILSALPAQAYWAVRLAPDGLIALLAGITLLVDGRRPGPPSRILWAIGAIAAVIVAVSIARGIDVSTSVNALRVVVRYVALGALVWRWSADPNRTWRLFASALVVGGLLQVAFGLAETLPQWARALASGASIEPADGTFDRYDRYGLFVGSIALLLIARTAERVSFPSIVFLGACLVALFLSTSRQAELGMGVGALLVAAIPRIPARTRVVALVCAAAAVAMVALTPTQIARPAGDAERPPPPRPVDPLPPSAPGPGPGTPITKGSSQFSVDPNENFRLYLNLDLAPWSVMREPLFGLGPGSHIDPDPTTPLARRVADAGMSWQYAVAFMNDSNAASLVIQFGLPFALAFLILLGLGLLTTLRSTWPSPRPIGLFALGAGATMAVAAVFGPAFEIRSVASVTWIAIALAVATAHPRADPTGAVAS